MKKKKTANNKYKKTLKPKTENQERYIRGMVEADITICSGPAGSGKTAVCVGLACEYLLEQKVGKIVITRPIVEAGKGLGYLPGGFHEKVQPYIVPIIEEMSLYLGRDNFESLKDSGVVEICPLEFMRGRNFHGSFIILDEAQNATFEQIKMFMTRIGRRSKAIINGDLRQSDLSPRIQGGMEYCIDKLEGLRGVSICELDDSDIIRHGIISKILDRLSEGEDEWQM
jgi:phosphate starvation-inducible PhoH-like protein